MHHLLYQALGQTSLIPRPTYEKKLLSVVENGAIAGGSLEDYVSKSDEIIQSMGDIEDLRKDTHCKPYAQALHAAYELFEGFLETALVEEDELYVCVLPTEHRYSLQNRHVNILPNQKAWLQAIISFFEELTESGYCMKEEVTFSDFLFSEEGEVLYFLSYHLIYKDLIDPVNTRTLENNLRVLKQLVLQFYDYYYFHSTRAEPVRHDAYIEILHNKLKHGLKFSTFQQFLIEEYDSNTSDAETIAVFFDTANILTGLRNFSIEFHQLFSQLFGLERSKNITEQYATLFYPVYEDESKTRKEFMKRQELKATLEKQGFTVIEVKNDQARAKKVVDGAAYDIDDQALITKIKQRMSKFHTICLFTGDQHFIDVIEECKRHGKEVKVISVHPEDTSQALIDKNKDDHYFITEFWSSLQFNWKEEG